MHRINNLQILSDHSWDFRLRELPNEAETDDVVDARSSLVARLRGTAVRTNSGLVLDGGQSCLGFQENGGYVDIDPWVWGGTTSIEIYVNYNSFNLASRVLDFSNEGYDEAVSLFNRGTSLTIDWTVRQNDDTDASLLTSNLISSHSTWTHILLAVKDTTMLIYKDGFLVGCQRYAHEPRTLTRTHHTIGAMHPASTSSSSTHYFHGKIAFLRFYHNKKLTAEAARNLFETRELTF
ncbi:hypothetical protein TL16_g05365 [Triparma laevis f. inornata]|uniref:Lectin n=1 Tax=Triparma laevis f. inornata TaxID=1714386 RepID=A0A9W7AHY6_9STRA|nr:hypothetical protein TL16_g05365 [Triparma laevis f. inornata]